MFLQITEQIALILVCDFLGATEEPKLLMAVYQSLVNQEAADAVCTKSKPRETAKYILVNDAVCGVNIGYLGFCVL